MNLRFTKTLAFRLTLLYSVIFSTAFLLVFAVIYIVVERALFENTDTDLLDDILEIQETYKKGGLQGLKVYIQEETRDDGPENLLLRITGPEGLLYSSDTSTWGDIPIIGPNGPGHDEGQPVFTTFTIPKRPALKARSMWFPVGRYMVQEAVPMGWDQSLLGELRHAFFVGALFTVFIAISSGWIMAKRTLSKVKEIDRVARRIAEGNDISQRVPLRGTGDEIDSLAATFNAMLERLESFVQELSDMLDNTAHDFKTPLARIRAMAETSLQNKDVESVHGALVQIMNESDRFLSVLNAIMDISEAKTGLLTLKREPVPADELFEEVASLFRGISKAKEIRFNAWPYQDGEGMLYVDKRRILQSLLNILDNAFKFTPSGRTVAFWYERQGEWVVFNVSDTGPGIPEAERSRIFERFYRHDRSRSSPGRGIGLSLAKAYVEAHGGKITVKGSSPSGSTFSIWLPFSCCH